MQSPVVPVKRDGTAGELSVNSPEGYKKNYAMKQCFAEAV
jgi:hypothetical protein